MNVKKLVAEIDAKINSLQHAREVLLALDDGGDKHRRGRPKGISTKASTSTASKAIRPKHTLSPEARKRIADGQKRRWAKQRKITPKAEAQN